MKQLAATAFLAILLLGSFAGRAPAADTPQTTEQQIEAVTLDEGKAIAAVVKIVNQPVAHLKMNYTPGMVSVFSPGWLVT